MQHHGIVCSGRDASAARVELRHIGQYFGALLHPVDARDVGYVDRIVKHFEMP